MTETARIGFAPEIEVACAMPELDGSVAVSLRMGDQALGAGRLTAEEPCKRLELSFDVVRGDVELCVDSARGEVSASGHLAFKNPLTGQWHTVLTVDGDVLIRYGPARGSIGGNPQTDPPVVDSPEFGTSRTSSEQVTRFFVDDTERVLADVGRVVKRALWRDHPDWVFNTVACVGPFEQDGRGTYCDPSSIWFNVFLGYYQIDAPKSGWSRPFGYTAASGAESTVEFEDVVRLAKSDWNYFSNWMYGVPAEAIEPYDVVDMARVEAEQSAPARVGSSLWHPISVGGVDSVSAYESGADGAAQLVPNSLLSGQWRRAFGLPNPHTDWPESFIGTTLEGKLYMAYWEDDEAFHTVMFGGTAGGAAPEPFLEAQLAAAHVVIERTYPTLGFALPSTASG